MSNRKDFEITPLGAAIVEALPDQQLKRRIQSNFRKRSECPVSDLFSSREVEEYYRDRGQNVKAVQRSK